MTEERDPPAREPEHSAGTRMADSLVLTRITDSFDFSVGGGSASALAGSMAAGLVAMVTRLSENGQFGMTPSRCRSLAEEADGLSRQLLQGAEADAEAYGLLAASYRLPRGSPDSQEAREAAILRAAFVAASVPRDNAHRVRRVVELCRELDGRSNPNAGSDLAVARVLSGAALVGCVQNIIVNLPLIHDADLANELSREATQLRQVAIRELTSLATREDA